MQQAIQTETAYVQKDSAMDTHSCDQPASPLMAVRQRQMKLGPNKKMT